MGNIHLNVQKRNVTEKYIEIRGIAKKIQTAVYCPLSVAKRSKDFWPIRSVSLLAKT